MRKIIISILVSALFLIGGGMMAAQEVPDDFNQAPMLDESVQQGELPEVEERLPEKDDVYVVEPNEDIGQYGGTAHTAGLSIEADGDDQMLASSPMLIRPNAEATDFLPHFAKDIEISEDKTTYTIHFREGVKWSDGEPFTTEDVMFWYEDVLQNEDITPAIGDGWKSDGNLMDMEKVDDYTVKITFDKPKPYFLNNLYMDTNYWAMITPKHYMKQFHIDYVEDEDDLREKAEEEGYDSWYELYLNKFNMQYGLPLNPDLPTVTAYKMVKRSSNRREFERNPYFWKVDAEGNQLPYIDKLSNEIVSDKEVLQGRIMSGEIDFAGFNNDIRNYPMYRNYEEEGGYKTHLWRAGYKSDTVYMFNLTSEDSAKREIFQDENFRKAMSLAIDREAINDTIYFGKAEPVQYSVLDVSEHYDEKYETYIEYDPDKAAELLDEMGLKDQDGDGWREDLEGEEFTFTIEYITAETPKSPNIEMVVENWKEIGINVETRQISGELQGQRAPANMLDATVWHGDMATDMLFPLYPYYYLPYVPAWSKTIWPEWARWFQTEGESGQEPPAEIKELRDHWEEIMTEPDKDRRAELSEIILETQAEKLWTIGTVGKTPWAIVASENLSNLPEDVLWCWDTLWTISRDPEQFYFEE